MIGVLPPSFDFASVFAPGSRIDLVFAFPLVPETNRWGNTLAMIGRLKPGKTVASARSEMAVLAPHMVEARGRDHNGFVCPSMSARACGWRCWCWRARWAW